MISIEDCIAMSDLGEWEILAIAEHEHIPEIAAAALGNHLMQVARGPEKIRDMIGEGIRLALERGDKAHARRLVAAMRRFVDEHGDKFRN